MMKNSRHHRQPSQPPPVTRHKTMMKNYYVCQQGGTPQGPFPEAMVMDAYAQGIYDNQTMICEKSASHWVYIKDAFAATTLRPRQASSSAKPYTRKERLLLGFCWLSVFFVLCSIHGVLGFLFFIITLPILDCYNIKRDYGLSWKEASVFTFMFLGIAILCFVPGFLISDSSNVPRRLIMLPPLLIAHCVRSHLLRKKYGNRR